MSESHGYDFEEFAIGQPVPRGEDPVLLRGEGCYTDDAQAEGTGQAYVLRSPYLHGAITALDTVAARAMPDVIAILTATDLDAQGIGDLPCMVADRLKGHGDTPLVVPSYPPLAKGKCGILASRPPLWWPKRWPKRAMGPKLLWIKVDQLAAVTDPRARRSVKERHSCMTMRPVIWRLTGSLATRLPSAKSLPKPTM